MANSQKKILQLAFPLLMFAIVYSAGVTLLCHLTRDFPTVLHVENSIFDKVQVANTLDASNYKQHHRQVYVDALEKVHLIDLDQEMNAAKGGGIDKLRLSHLLDLVGQIPTLKAVYLDYLYEIPSCENGDDAILCRNMANLGARLVLPFAYSLDKSGSYFSYLNSSAVSCQTDIICKEISSTGYTSGEPLPGDPAIRYLRLEMPSRHTSSCAYLLANLTHEHDAPRVANEIDNGQMEMAFVCDNPPSDSKGIFHITEASRLLKTPDLALTAIKAQQPELILIGHFKDQKNTGCRNSEAYPTIINKEMFGSMIVLNGWLNIVTEGYLRRSGLGFIFVFNFLLGFLGGLWVVAFPAKERKQFWIYVIEVFGIGVLFFGSMMVIYLNWNVKLGFTIPLLVYVRCEYLARKFFLRFDQTQKESVT